MSSQAKGTGMAPDGSGVLCYMKNPQKVLPQRAYVRTVLYVCIIVHVYIYLSLHVCGLSPTSADSAVAISQNSNPPSFSTRRGSYALQGCPPLNSQLAVARSLPDKLLLRIAFPCEAQPRALRSRARRCCVCHSKGNR